MLLTSFITLIFSDFCYIAKYWNFDRIKFLTQSVYVKHLSEESLSLSLPITNW